MEGVPLNYPAQAAGIPKWSGGYDWVAGMTTSWTAEHNIGLSEYTQAA